MKVLRTFALLLLLLAVVAGVALWLATRPGQTESPAGGSGTSAEATDSARRAGEAPPAGQSDPATGDPDALLRRLRDEGRISLSPNDVVALTRAVLSDSPDGREFLRVSRDFEAIITADFVEVGATFDLAELDETALSEDARAAIERMRSTVPFLLNGERYLGARGMPLAVNGKLGFGPDATLRVGSLGLPIGLLTWLGSEDEIANATFELPDVELVAVDVEEGLLRIEGRPSR